MASITPTKAITTVSDLSSLPSRPLPTAPDGEYDYKNTIAGHHSALTKLINDLEAGRNVVKSNLHQPTADAYITAQLHPGGLDDRKGEWSAGMGALAVLPPDNKAAKQMADKTTEVLYNSTNHPVDSYMGPEHTHRQANGGGNNLLIPSIGQGGTPYARSVQGRICIDETALPDPEIIFETLLRARKHEHHPGGVSSLAFGLATFVIHSIFYTNGKDTDINDTSSYFDLSPLYGIDQASQDRVRDKASGRGLLYPDTFSEERLNALPPGTGAMLVLFCRNHNYTAQNLLLINEWGRWSNPPPTDPVARAKQDEDIFQTARLVNCGHFMGLVFYDYVPSLLGRNEHRTWEIKPFDPITTPQGRKVTRGKGNHCSMEFNLVYRWHSVLSEADIKWTEKQFQDIYKKPIKDITMSEFISRLEPLREKTRATKPSQRTFGGLKRGHDSKFSDADLAKVFQDATENPACRFGARGIADVYKPIEMMGIRQARQWGACTLNEFRAFMGLKTLESFEEWNPDPEIAAAARRLYGHIDQLELYVGLHAEATIPLTPGMRFAGGFTTTRALLGDAVAVVRGDRFSTCDYSPANLTTWGFQDCQPQRENGGYGGTLPKLLMRHLPNHYPFNSVYGCFPFYTPQIMKDSLTRLGTADQYTFTRPLPTPAQPKVLNTYKGIHYAFDNPSLFHTIYDMKSWAGGYGYMMSFDNREKHDPDRLLASRALVPKPEVLGEYRRWYRDTFKRLVKERSWKYDGVPSTYLDIVHVLNAVCVHWASDRLCALSIKTEQNPSGMYTEQEAFDMYGVLFVNIFGTLGNNERQFATRAAADQAYSLIGAALEKAFYEVAPELASNPLARVAASVTQVVHHSSKKPYYPFLRALADSKQPLNRLIGLALGTAVAMTANYAQAMGLVFAFYLDPARSKEKEHIIQLASHEDERSFDLLRGYLCEGMRLAPQVPSLVRVAVADSHIPQGQGLPDVFVYRGDQIFASFVNAQLNAADFPNPTKVDPTRPKSSYFFLGTGFHGCPGFTLAELTMTEILKEAFKLKNLRLAPGNAGKMHGFNNDVFGTKIKTYIRENGTLSPWATSLHLQYDV